MAPRRFLLVLLFGFVLIYVPAVLFSGAARPAEIGTWQAAGIVIGSAGAAVVLWCVSNFALLGRGTPVPFAPPSRLVTRGPYRYVRNPMYLGAGAFFAGAALFYESPVLGAYTVFFFLASHGFIVWYEEPTLRQKFGREYDAYCERVGRWRPRGR